MKLNFNFLSLAATKAVGARYGILRQNLNLRKQIKTKQVLINATSAAKERMWAETSTLWFEVPI